MLKQNATFAGLASSKVVRTALAGAAVAVFASLYAPQAQSQVPGAEGPRALRAITGRQVMLDTRTPKEVVALRNIPAGTYIVFAKVGASGGVVQCTLKGPERNLQFHDGASSNENISQGSSSWTLPMMSTLTSQDPFTASVACFGNAPREVAPARTSGGSIIAVKIGSQSTTSGDPAPPMKDKG